MGEFLSKCGTFHLIRSIDPLIIQFNEITDVDKPQIDSDMIGLVAEGAFDNPDDLPVMD